MRKRVCSFVRPSVPPLDFSVLSGYVAEMSLRRTIVALLLSAAALAPKTRAARTPLPGLPGPVSGEVFSPEIGRQFQYAEDGRVVQDRLVFANGGPPDFTLDYAWRPADGRPTGFALDGAAREIEIGYDPALPFRVARSADRRSGQPWSTASYGYAGASTLLETVALRPGDEQTPPVMTRSIQWDRARRRIAAIEYRLPDNTLVASYAYDYWPDTDLIRAMTLADGSWWAYEYDDKNHLRAADLFAPDGQPVPGRQYFYETDDMGNTLARVRALADGAVAADVFEADALNLHTTRVWSDRIELAGRADPAAVVTVNGVPARRDGAEFRAVLLRGPDAPAGPVDISIAAVQPVSTNDYYHAIEGELFVPRRIETGEHLQTSLTGAADRDSRFAYIFDWRERLIQADTIAADPAYRVRYDYCPDGRRLRKRVFLGPDGPDDGLLVREHRYAYDRWNMIRETIEADGETVVRHYHWGLDIAGWRVGAAGQAAGGIGGLHAIRVERSSGTETYFPFADHNGNIRGLVDETGAVVARYDYSPYGEVEWSGPAREECPFLFQSKYYDAETELYYYGYRYYSPATTKWLNRDPLEEAGGLNLTGFCRNNPIMYVDYLGLRATQKELMRGLLELLSSGINEPYFSDVGNALEQKYNLLGGAGPYHDAFIEITKYANNDYLKMLKGGLWESAETTADIVASIGGCTAFFSWLAIFCGRLLDGCFSVCLGGGLASFLPTALTGFTREA